MIKSLLVSLLLTIFVEEIIGFLLGIRGKYNFLVLILVNIITNPVIVYIANLLILLGRNAILIWLIPLLEVIVVIIEGLLFKKYLDYKKMNVYLLSFIMNLLSFCIGIII